jgi:hypothetical protein
MTTIKWTGSRGDYTAVSHGYILRAEMMDKGCWWWCCYRPDRTQSDPWTDDKWAKNGNQAKEFAIEAMNEHMKKQ